MEPEGSLPSPQETATGPKPEHTLLAYLISEYMSLFIQAYGLCNDAMCSKDCIASNDRLADE
jgi:hypothetical protein